MHILHVVGARPNFMKAAPVLHALQRRAGIKQTLVHTGQHYDRNLSEVFFSQLGIPPPEVNLEVGSGTHAQQTAAIMCRFETTLTRHKPDMVLVYGDVNSTAAAALVCAKQLIRVGHVEAGLRSGDRSMPEEINRIVTDHLADLLFTPSEDANLTLRHEGIDAGKVHFVGNVMIDSLVRLLPFARQCPKNGLPERFALVTLHRPSNVDDDCILKRILEALLSFAKEIEIVFPVHPRTRQKLTESRIDAGKLRLLDPLPYIEFLALQSRAAVVITDSGGIQEETTYLGVPCLTVRENTERPVTVTMGTNTLVGQDTGKLAAALRRALDSPMVSRTVPLLWDGQAGERIADILASAD